MLLRYSQFLKNSFQFANFFYRLVFRCKVLRPAVIYLFEVQSRVLLSSEVAIQRCSNFTGEYTYRSVISIKFLCKFIEITLWTFSCKFAVNLLHIFRTLFPKNTSGLLLLCLLLRKGEMC